jgi:peptide/nickel transport system substrate-binding protein
MTSSEYWDRWWRQRHSRRRLLATGGVATAGLAGLALVGCGDDDDDGGDGTSTATATSTGTGTSTGTATATATATGTSAPVDGGVYRYIGGPIGGNLDIHRTNTPFESAGVWHWAGNFLVRWSVTTLEPEPDLAADMPEITPDGLTYTFKINTAAKWQNKAPANGRNVTAEDVKFTFERIKGLGQKSPRSGNYSNTETITAIDEETVQFKLKAPQADLLRAMSDQYDIVIPKEIAERGEEAIKTPDDVVGSGPYELTAYEAGAGFTMTRRPDGYWKPGKAHYDSGEWTHQPDNQQKANALRAGQADATDLPADLVRTFQDDDDYQIVFAPNPTRECRSSTTPRRPTTTPWSARPSGAPSTGRSSIRTSSPEAASPAGPSVPPRPTGCSPRTSSPRFRASAIAKPSSRKPRTCSAPPAIPMASATPS